MNGYSAFLLTCARSPDDGCRGPDKVGHVEQGGFAGLTTPGPSTDQYDDDPGEACANRKFGVKQEVEYAHALAHPLTMTCCAAIVDDTDVQNTSSRGAPGSERK